MWKPRDCCIINSFPLLLHRPCTVQLWKRRKSPSSVLKLNLDGQAFAFAQRGAGPFLHLQLQVLPKQRCRHRSAVPNEEEAFNDSDDCPPGRWPRCKQPFSCRTSKRGWARCPQSCTKWRQQLLQQVLPRKEGLSSACHPHEQFYKQASFLYVLHHLQAFIFFLSTGTLIRFWPQTPDLTYPDRVSISVICRGIHCFNICAPKAYLTFTAVVWKASLVRLCVSSCSQFHRSHFSTKR